MKSLSLSLSFPFNMCVHTHTHTHTSTYISFVVMFDEMNMTPLVLQVVVLKMMAMNDEKTKQKAIEAAADIYGTTEHNHSSLASC